MMLHSLLLSSRSVKAIDLSKKKKKISHSSESLSSSSSSSAVYNTYHFIPKLPNQDITTPESCASDEMRTNSDSETSSAGPAERASAETRSERDQIYALSANVSSSDDEVNGVGGGGDVITLLSLRDLLKDCGISVCQRRWQRSMELVKVLKQKAAAEAGADGGAQRMALQFADILSATIHETCSVNNEYRLSLQRSEPDSNTARANNTMMNIMQSLDEESIQNASLSFNQVTPYLRFLHLTANQAVLEAVKRKQRVHIVDVEIMQGLQWPPFMQAMAEREGGPPAVMKITGGGRERRVLEQVGERLRKFAESVGIECFEYETMEYGSNHRITNITSIPRAGPRLQSLFRRENDEDEEEDDDEEFMVINCILQVGDMPWNNSRDQSITTLFTSSSSSSSSSSSLWSSISSAWMILSEILMRYRPSLVTIAEPEVDFSSSTSFEVRFSQATGHYSALFDSLDATLPPSCPHRAIVENVWLRSQIAGLLLRRNCNDNDIGGQCPGANSFNDGKRNGILYQNFTSAPSWRASLCSRGFKSVPMSDFAISQARLLLRLRYPSEGYHLRQFFNNSGNVPVWDQHCLALGWQCTPLFTVSAWKSP